jgi:hypothetical protein
MSGPPRRVITAQPRTRRQDGPWTVYEWPDIDVPAYDLAAMRIPFDLPPGTPFLRSGWQSWSAPSIGVLGEGLKRPVEEPVTTGRRHWLHRPPYSGDETYDIFVADGYVAGFERGGGVLAACPREGELLAIREHVPGLEQPSVRVASGDADARVAELLAGKGGRVPAAVPITWCSWEAFYEHLSEEVLLEELARARVLEATGLLEAFLVDDGYQPAVGDWTADQLRFPRGMDDLAARITESGLLPGIWLAPFAVGRHSEIAARRPEWLLRDREGSAVVPFRREDHWGGATFTLDITRPDVREHLADTASRLAAEGWRILKLDFLYFGAYAADVAAERSAAGETLAGDRLDAEGAVRLALEAIRQGAGEDVLLIGCGSPLAPAVGIVDIMRTSCDVKRYWDPEPTPGCEDQMAASLCNAWRGARLNSYTHDRLWCADPDLVMLSASTLSAGQRRDWALWCGEAGQMLTISDRLTGLSPSELALWEEAVGRWRSARSSQDRGRERLSELIRHERPSQLVDR